MKEMEEEMAENNIEGDFVYNLLHHAVINSRYTK
jgi:hypothetical protein